jgi:sugar phosphate isomerase/epimerase
MKKRKILYSYSEAKVAAKLLGCKTKKEYCFRYKKDPKLPREPKTIYAEDWSTWPTFLGRPDKCFYETIADAQRAAQKLGIKTVNEYLLKYKKDPKLPSSPKIIYAENWSTWFTFLGRPDKYFYETIADAQRAAQKLGIKTVNEYLLKYKKDPKLPREPKTIYAEDWLTWPNFFGRPIKHFYKTIAEAQYAAQKLGIKTSKEYYLKYKKDPKLPSSPKITYSEDWLTWYDFFGRPIKHLYKTIAEVQRAAQKLGVKTKKEYHLKYKKDPKLPREPKTI